MPDNEEAAEKVDETAETQEIDLGMDYGLPEVEMPSGGAEVSIVKDEFKLEPRVRFCFVGVGQGGGRFAEAFYKLGYRRVCAINTAESDLSGLDIPEKNKLCLGTGGAAKTRAAGRTAMEDRSEDVLEFMRRCFGSEFDRIIVLATAGGGTGSGGFVPGVRLANDLIEDLRIDVGSEARVGLFLAIPPNSEADRMGNALEALKDVEKLLKAKKASPVLLIDNERIRDIYPTATMGETWDRANLNIAGLFHTFNLLAGAPTKYDSFDEADYKSLLASGLITCGAMPVSGDLAVSFRDNISKTVVMSGLDLSSAGVGACLLVGKREEIDKLEWAAVQTAYASLCRVIGGCTLHRGLYASARSLAAHTLIGGLSMPKARLDEITRLVNKKKDWDL